MGLIFSSRSGQATDAISQPIPPPPPPPLDDPILPSLWSIKQALDDFNSDANSGSVLSQLLCDCIAQFKNNAEYRNDPRFLKIWILYMGFIEDYEDLFLEMLERKICTGNALLYVWFASFLESKGKLYDAKFVYQMGISSKAKPTEWVDKAHTLFLQRMSELLASPEKAGDDEFIQFDRYINPWSSSTLTVLLKNVTPQLTKYDGYHSTNKAYSGVVALPSLKSSSRNKIIELGRIKYQIKGYAGQGDSVRVYKAFVNGNPHDVVALKIQKPAFPWEFYMYRELDQRISDKERSSYGFAQRVHLYSDCSILVCNYLPNRTLQDAINLYAATGQPMDEVLCIYYTIEMLYMLETLHDVGIIHGDFKPDNLLIRYTQSNDTFLFYEELLRSKLTVDGFLDRSGPWLNQGLCLVDWGRGIDLRLFPDNMEFKGDCRTSGYRCVEMQEDKPWTFQVDTYGLCVVVHTMLHNSYMEIEKKPSPDGSYIYLPKSSFKRYWKVELWKNFYEKLLNSSPGTKSKELLQNLRESFQEYMCSNPHLIKKLISLLAKQRVSIFLENQRAPKEVLSRGITDLAGASSAS